MSENGFLFRAGEKKKKKRQIGGSVLKPNEKKKPELLCPAGRPDSLRAAVTAGADAVYFGAKEFNARQMAQNFSREEIRRAVDLCHAHGVRAYIALNTLVLDRETEQALDLASFLYEAGCDALIVADAGLAAQIRKFFPDFELHASTQMSGHSTADAQAFAEMGFSRMVCARELDKQNLSLLCRRSPIEIELFVHGALCSCHSGQCLMSSMIGNRSGNRGACAQPCRLPYNGSYPLSLKDLSLARHVREILTLGVASLKIEGRMKGADYVFSATRLFRTLLDEARDATDEEMRALAGVFSRSGFTDGYFTGKKSSAMLGRRTEDDGKKHPHPAPRPAAPRRIDPKPIDLHRKKVVLPPLVIPRGENSPARRTAQFYSPAQIPQNAPFDLIFLPLFAFDETKADGVSLPPVVFDTEAKTVRRALEDAAARGARHALLSSPAQKALCEGLGFVLHGSFRWNITNSFSLMQASDLEDAVVSPELNLAQMRDLPAKKSVIVYGRLPLMLLEKPVGAKRLADRRRTVFPVLSEGGRDLVLNSVPVYMADRADKLRKAGLFHHFFLFTTETKREVEQIIDAYGKHLPATGPIRRIPGA